LLGFDFPIGLPQAYSELAHIDNFREALGRFGQDQWKDFFQVAVEADDIRIHRPFYPKNCLWKGQRTHRHLTSALGLTWDQLHRRCERPTQERPAACPLFWTLGGNQVGKGALSGWREILQPAIRDMDSRVALWPFDGRLNELIIRGRVVITETYPAEFYRHIGVRFGSRKDDGKRSAAARRRNAPALVGWARHHRVSMTQRLLTELEDGFGPTGDGEDAFDAVAGLIGMLNVVIVRRSPGEPTAVTLRSIEGWILGQAAPYEEGELP